MAITLSENISKYRKEKQMTQEDLASALGVTFAAVSKWERGVATPELSLIVRMASLFGVSTDSLIGYEMEDKNINMLDKKIEEYLVKNNYKAAIDDICDALVKYPNNFKIVYLGAKTYYIFGFKLDNMDYVRKCIGLFEKAILLISQNDNNEISEVSIKGEIAQCYIKLGEVEKGIEILKKYNVNGLYSPAIAYTGTMDNIKNMIDVEPFINDSITIIFSNLALTILSNANYHIKIKKYDRAIEVLLWFKDVLLSIKRDKNKNTYYDKVVSYLYAKAALCAYYLNDGKEFEYLNNAYECAIKFDNDPVVKLDNIMLYTDNLRNVFALDALGDSAIESVYNAIKEEKSLVEKWNIIIKGR